MATTGSPNSSPHSAEPRFEVRIIVDRLRDVQAEAFDRVEAVRWIEEGRPPYDPVLMFKILILQTVYALSGDATEFQIWDRLSFMRFLGLMFEDAVPDAKTLWLFREHLTRAGAIDALFVAFDAWLRGKG